MNYLSPRLATALLSASLPRDAAAEVLGDLEEAFHAQARLVGKTRARAWYWGEALRFVVRLLFTKVTRVGLYQVHLTPTKHKASSMSTFVQDLRYALRTLMREPGFTAVAVVILAVRIGANVAIFSITDAELFRSLPFPDADPLVMGRTTWSGELARNVSSPDYYDYRDQSRSFESLAAILTGPLPFTMTGGGEPKRLQGVIAGVDLFPTVGVEPQLGRNFAADERNSG